MVDNPLQCPLFVEFLQKQDIDPDHYRTDPPRRYIRLNPTSTTTTKSELLHQLPFAKPVPWLDNFYSLMEEKKDDDNDNDEIMMMMISLPSLPLYRQGHVYGMCASSGYAVQHVLQPCPGECILDLCCAPGTKMTLIADCMHRTGTLVGLDVSTHRIQTCKQVLYKYKVIQCAAAAADDNNNKKNWRVVLYCGDGTQWKSNNNNNNDNNHTVQCILDTDDLKQHDPHALYHARRNKSQRARERKRLMNHHNNNNHKNVLLFDKILVDAECTHDGSLKHLTKKNHPQPPQDFEKYVQDYLNETTVNQLITLQLALLTNAFQLLKVGGIVVYSTCSLSPRQNEEVVSQFLKCQESARLLPIRPDPMVPCQAGGLPGTIRFTPRYSHTGGLFVAKIQKIK